MSWQADIEKLHNRAKTLRIDLSEFEEDVKDEDGWYTDFNIQVFIECLLEALEDSKV